MIGVYCPGIRCLCVGTRMGKTLKGFLWDGDPGLDIGRYQAVLWYCSGARALFQGWRKCRGSNSNRYQDRKSLCFGKKVPYELEEDNRRSVIE